MALDRMLKTGHTVYLHCTAGTGRSPTVAAAYLHWCLAWPLERALAHLRDARDCSPNAEAMKPLVHHTVAQSLGSSRDEADHKGCS